MKTDNFNHYTGRAISPAEAATRQMAAALGGERIRTLDEAVRTQDSSLSYQVNQLEDFDQTLHKPLSDVTWGRDIDLRPGLKMTAELASFTRSIMGTTGTQSVGGKPWFNPKSNTIPGVSINGEKVARPVRLLAREVAWNEIELERSQDLGQPLDMAQMEALNMSYQMDTDACVYIGDAEMGFKGLVNNDAVVTTADVGNGAWATETDPDKFLGDVNEILVTAWERAAYAVCPSDLLLPPLKFARLVALKVSSAGNISILNYIKENCISAAINGRPLNIRPLKWCNAAARTTAAAPVTKDRMVAYTKDVGRVRFPLVPIRRFTSYVQGLRYATPYAWAYGEMEFLYPETVLYRDNI